MFYLVLNISVIIIKYIVVNINCFVVFNGSIGFICIFYDFLYIKME